jgi:hypothetical protein
MSPPELKPKTGMFVLCVTELTSAWTDESGLLTREMKKTKKGEWFSEVQV